MHNIIVVDVGNRKGGLAMLWTNEVDITLRSYCCYHIDVYVESSADHPS